MHISNISWGGYNGQYILHTQLADWAVRGEFGARPVNMVIISHNHNALATSPGTAKNALTVGAVKDGNSPQATINFFDLCSDDNWPPAERVCFSNFGPIDADNDGATRVKPDLVAPGVYIRSAAPWDLSPSGDSYYYTDEGTSFAAPQVAGAISLMLSVRSTLTYDEIIQGLKLSARKHVTSKLSGVNECFRRRCLAQSIQEVTSWMVVESTA